MNFSQQLKTSKSDEYYTPAYAVEIILPYLKQRGFQCVWCPFDKEDSEFVKLLKEAGFEVIYGHIETGQDFFEYELPPFEADCIISNPPFSERDKVFKRLYEIGLPFAVIMNANGLFDSKIRYDLFKNNSFELLIPRGRVRFFDEQMIARDRPNFQSIYVCDRILNKQIEFTDMEIT